MPKPTWPGIAASVAVIAKRDRAVLLIRRRYPPFRGAFAFPGGFLEVGEEDLYQTAARELREETGIRAKPEQLRLLDARSRPRRDPRGHIIDIGFLFVLPRKAPLPAQTSETKPLWVPFSRADRLRFAFDHAAMWRNAKAALRSRPLPLRRG